MKTVIYYNVACFGKLSLLLEHLPYVTLVIHDSVAFHIFLHDSFNSEKAKSVKNSCLLCACACSIDEAFLCTLFELPFSAFKETNASQYFVIGDFLISYF